MDESKSESPSQTDPVKSEKLNKQKSVEAALQDLHRTLDEGSGYPFHREVGEKITDPVVKKHVKEITAALASKPVNVRELRRLARWGFVNNELRKQVWPHLLGVDLKKKTAVGEKEKKEHEWVRLIDMDIARSMGHFDLDEVLTDEQKKVAREGLKTMVNSIFEDPANQELHYIQGYHDVCTVFFRICGPDLGALLIDHLSKRHIRDTLRSDIGVLTSINNLLFPLIGLVDREVYQFLVKSEVSSTVAISWILTW